MLSVNKEQISAKLCEMRMYVIECQPKKAPESGLNQIQDR